MTTLLWILGAVALVLLALILYPNKKPTIKKRPILSDYQKERIVQPTAARSPLLDPIPRAVGEVAVAKWMILDLQTTSLNTEEGEEARILEASWALLDENYKLITRHTYRVRQEVSSSPEAFRVHGIADTLQTPYSITEQELVERWSADLKPRITLVGHNIAFDRAILLGTVGRVAPHLVTKLEQLPTLCTMTYLCTSPDSPYPSLVHLTEELAGIPPPRFYSLRPISWRNVYFTRLCLLHLLPNNH